METNERGNRARALSEADEKVLLKLLDGECGVLETWRAERILRGNPHAQNFLRSMRQVAVFSQEGLRRSGSVDLWGRVSKRIEEEKRAELFLGKRAMREPIGWNPLGWFDMLQLRWGAAGALVTACLGVAIIFVNQQMKSAPAGASYAKLSTENSLEAQLPPFEGGFRSAAVDRVSNEVLASKNYPRALEVDWMRSDGRVRMIEDPSSRSTIIWVKKLTPEEQLLSVRRTKRGLMLVQSKTPVALTVSGR